jgi:hypothetical protein
MEKTVAARDGCVVDSAPLSSILGDFVEEWKRTRPADTRFSRNEIPVVSPIEYLSLETGIPERTIKNVVKGAYRTTELRIADALVAAIGRPEVFHDGTLSPFENPLADKETKARGECCGGSG